MPGGLEWLVIIVIALLLFVPGIVIFGAGYLFGKKAGEQGKRFEAEDVSQAERDGEPVEPEMMEASSEGKDADA